MRDENGFIATSVLYSFFLVFIAVIIAHINSYLANKNILERFNEEAASRLNESIYQINIYSKNATITGGNRYQNMLSNSDFSNGLNNWYPSNGNFAVIDNFLSETVNGMEQYVSQPVELINNHVYYFAINYSQTNDYTTKTYLTSNASENDYIATAVNNGSGITQFKRIEMQGTSGNYDFRLGYVNNYQSSGTTFFNNTLLIDITDTFGVGKEPSEEWLSQNIDWFDGVISHISKEKSDEDKDINLKMVPFNNNPNIKSFICSSGGYNSPDYTTSSENGKTRYEITDCGNGENTCNIYVEKEQDEYSIKIIRLTSDVRCDIEWS